jgi:prepilin-type processing-associated H-X9-DG protein
LPAVQSAREAGRRAKCQNNLKQLSLAMLNYESTHKRFPIGAVGVHPVTGVFDYDIQNKPCTSFFNYLFPYIEETAIDDIYNYSITVQAQPNNVQELLRRYYPVFHCPSDESQRIAQGSSLQYSGFKGSYGVNWGQNTYMIQGKPSPFFIEFGAKVKHITDGTSKTMAFMEMWQVPSLDPDETQVDRRSRLWNCEAGCYQITTKYGPNDRAPDNSRCTNTFQFPCINSANGPNARFEQYIVSRSRHPGGVYVAMCDGSIHFYENEIDINLWRNLSSMSGGEVDDEYSPPPTGPGIR